MCEASCEFFGDCCPDYTATCSAYVNKAKNITKPIMEKKLRRRKWLVAKAEAQEKKVRARREYRAAWIKENKGRKRRAASPAAAYCTAYKPVAETGSKCEAANRFDVDKLKTCATQFAADAAVVYKTHCTASVSNAACTSLHKQISAGSVTGGMTTGATTAPGAVTADVPITKTVTKNLATVKVMVPMAAGTCETQTTEEVQTNIKTIAEKTGAAGLMDLTSGSSKGECMARRSRERRASKDNFKVTLVFKESTSADQVAATVTAAAKIIKSGGFKVELVSNGKKQEVTLPTTTSFESEIVTITVSTPTDPPQKVPKAAAGRTAPFFGLAAAGAALFCACFLA